MDIKNDAEGKEFPGQTGSDRWKGLAEIDQAIDENRLTQYRVKKAWADPWNRIALFVLMSAIAAFVIYVVVDELNF